MAAEFDYLVRFVDETGKIVYGNLTQLKEDPTNSKAELLSGDLLTGLKKTGETRTIAKVVSLLPSAFS